MAQAPESTSQTRDEGPAVPIAAAGMATEGSLLPKLRQYSPLLPAASGGIDRWLCRFPIVTARAG